MIVIRELHSGILGELAEVIEKRRGPLPGFEGVGSSWGPGTQHIFELELVRLLDALSPLRIVVRHREMGAGYAEPGIIQHLFKFQRGAPVEIDRPFISEAGFDLLVAHGDEFRQSPWKIGFEIVANGVQLNAEWQTPRIGPSLRNKSRAGYAGHQLRNSLGVRFTRPPK